MIDSFSQIYCLQMSEPPIKNRFCEGKKVIRHHYHVPVLITPIIWVELVSTLYSHQQCCLSHVWHVAQADTSCQGQELCMTGREEAWI